MNENNWFEKVTSIKEKEWDFDIDTLPKLDYGKFEEVYISDLKKELDDIKPNKTKTMTIRIRECKTEENEKYFDTSALQFNSPNHAMYQVASNFDCHECGSEFTNVFSGKYLTNLMSDNTQGPSAAGGAAYGAILRLAIHKIKKINLISDMIDFEPKNGKIYDYEYDNAFGTKLLKIGLHTDVRATFDRSTKFKFNPNGPLIDQVYTSTCICENNKNKSKLSHLLLQGAYEGTYLCAVLRKSKILVLTLIGGGVFNNSHAQIATEIIEAHKKYSPYLQKDCKVMLPIYDDKGKDVYEILKKKLDIKTEMY